MARILNPNDIVDEYVNDYRLAAQERLLSVFLYGAAVTHEFRPGFSLVKSGIVLSDLSIPDLEPLVAIQKKWSKRGMATPTLLSPHLIESSLDTFPVDFYDMQSNYRILHGADILAGLQIRKTHLRLQCERELKQCAIELRGRFLSAAGDTRELEQLLYRVIERLAPVLRALLALNGLPVPTITSDMVGNVEDLYGLGLSVFAELFTPAEPQITRDNVRRLCSDLVSAVDTISQKLDSTPAT